MPLAQNRSHDCVFFSRQLTPTERNYDIWDKQHLKIRAASEEWQHILEEAQEPAAVLTYHQSLEYN